MAQQPPMTCQNPQSLNDVTYDLSTTLSSLGKGAHILGTYIEDAKQANDAAAANVLGQIREGLLCEADRLRGFMCDQMKQGKF
ncbi:MAG: hypothetical protein ACRDIY_20520 [Chloroflexota bacterium]